MNAHSYLKEKISDSKQLSKKKRRLEQTISSVTFVEEPPLLTEDEVLAITTSKQKVKKNEAVATSATSAMSAMSATSATSATSEINVNKLTIYVRSSDGKKKYHVNICYTQQGIIFECNCGDQFGIKEKRNHCKHVATAIVQMNKTFLDSHIKGDKIQAVDKNAICQIVDLLEKFDFS